ncbi:hypothetical protein V8E53_009171 [Lactarius tabidus]
MPDTAPITGRLVITLSRPPPLPSLSLSSLAPSLLPLSCPPPSLLPRPLPPPLPHASSPPRARSASSPSLALMQPLCLLSLPLPHAPSLPLLLALPPPPPPSLASLAYAPLPPPPLHTLLHTLRFPLLPCTPSCTCSTSPPSLALAISPPPSPAPHPSLSP